MIGLKEAYDNNREPDSVPDIAENTFCENGWLQNALDLEYRPEQEQMAIATAQAFTTDSSLIFEAGTGVGKSIAYLIPAIIYAIDTNRQCIISTHTIALQEQIQRKDLPLCRQLFQGQPDLIKYKDFKTALLVGRGNYLCSTRLSQAIESKLDLFPTPEQQELDRIIEWSRHTQSGIIHELNPMPHPAVWEWVNADTSACNRRHCNPDSCFFQKARARLQNAQIIIINHSLLFSLIGAGAVPHQERGILFANDFIVIDEAQTAPDVATDQLGHRISSLGLDRLLKRLYNPRRKKGLLSRCGSPGDCEAVEKTIREASMFFTRIRRDSLDQQDIVRIYHENWCDPTLSPHLQELIDRVSTLASKQEDGPMKNELTTFRTRLTGYKIGINQCISLDDEDLVYWVERIGRNRQIVVLRTAPLNVASHLKQCLFDRGVSALLTSATIAQGSDMDSFREKVGALGVEMEQVNSPFDYENNMRIFIASDSPPPSGKSAKLDTAFLSDAISFCTLQIQGGSLVLFTSYTDMRQVAKTIEEQFNKKKRILLMQGRDGSRSDLVHRFSEIGNGILFGTDSFWAGVDIPGPSLSQVVVTRLPFENPSHPVSEAKNDWITARGGNPFLEITLPEAIIKFRQGIGRLIRKKTDCGTITILDSRLLNKEYGRQFLSVLPNLKFEKFNRDNRKTVFCPLEAL